MKYDAEGIPQDVLEQDKMISAYPLKVNGTASRVVPVSDMFQ